MNTVPGFDDVPPFRPPDFSGRSRKTAQEAFGATAVRVACRAAADPKAALDACYEAHHERTGVRDIEPLDLNSERVRFPLKVVAAAQVPIDTLSKVLTDFERTNLFRRWQRTLVDYPAFGPPGSRCLVFHWHARWGETFALTDADWIETLPAVRPYDRPEFALYVFSHLVKHVGWWAVG